LLTRARKLGNRYTRVSCRLPRSGSCVPSVAPRVQVSSNLQPSESPNQFASSLTEYLSAPASHSAQVTRQSKCDLFSRCVQKMCRAKPRKIRFARFQLLANAPILMQRSFVQLVELPRHGFGQHSRQLSAARKMGQHLQKERDGKRWAGRAERFVPYRFKRGSLSLNVKSK